MSSSGPPLQEATSSSSAAQGIEPLSCVSCRARKLRCDRKKTACTRCVRIGNECVYPESRRKPTFKRRNVKELEARLAQVEVYLKEVTKGTAEPASNAPQAAEESAGLDFGDFSFDTDLPPSAGAEPTTASQSQDEFGFPDFSGPQQDFFGDTQLMDLGMSEALPPLEIIEELHTFFFQIHRSFLPVVHAGRYYEAFYSTPARKPPLCLSYAIWATAAHARPKYTHLAEIFYDRARSYANADEMKGHGESFITLGHAQAWSIIAVYEAKCMVFTRASMSCAKAVRLVHMLGLSRLDAPGAEFPPNLGEASTWSEEEERRRTFWGTFCIDAHSSISTGWASLINTDDVVARLPASEEAFETNKREEAPFLTEVFSGAPYHGFSVVIVMCQLFKSVLQHVHFPKPDDSPEDLSNGPFWKRHRDLDNKLSSLFMFLPERLRLPQNVRDPMAIQVNLNLHACVICLHHAALEVIERHKHPKYLEETSLGRLRTSAEEITSVIRLVGTSSYYFKGPLSSLSLYCATTVYVFLAKINGESALTATELANLDLIFQVMEVVSRDQEVTRAFLKQACLDIERNDLADNFNFPNYGRQEEIFGNTCSEIPLMSRKLWSPRDKPSSKTRRDGDVTSETSEPRRTWGSSSMSSGGEGGVRNQKHHAPLERAAGAFARIQSSTGNAKLHSSKGKESALGPNSTGFLNSSSSGTSSYNYVPIPNSNLRFGTQQTLRTVFPKADWHERSQTLRRTDLSAVLPDRTNSSASSSPANRDAGASTATATHSGSSHTSPDAAQMGLGSTAQKNRVDLRPFQNTIQGSLWPATDDASFEQIADAIMDDTLAMDDSDTWGQLTADLDWAHGASSGS